VYEDASPFYEIPPGERGYGGGRIIPNELPKERFDIPQEATENLKKAKSKGEEY
jgi:fumarate reductase flavoprotein subunit